MGALKGQTRTMVSRSKGISFGLPRIIQCSTAGRTWDGVAETGVSSPSLKEIKEMEPFTGML